MKNFGLPQVVAPPKYLLKSTGHRYLKINVNIHHIKIAEMKARTAV
jgi:hypothetical protein